MGGDKEGHVQCPYKENYWKNIELTLISGLWSHLYYGCGKELKYLIFL